MNRFKPSLYRLARERDILVIYIPVVLPLPEQEDLLFKQLLYSGKISFLMATTHKTSTISSNSTTMASGQESSRRRYGTRNNQRYDEAPRQRASHSSRAKDNTRPTHFLSLPLGQHPNLRSRITQFQSSLLEGSGSNAVRGLDASIFINPRRLHLTLGVMALSATSTSSRSRDSNNQIKMGERKTVESALELLQSLRPRLLALCEGKGGVRASLERIGAFESRQGARVLWVSPREQEAWSESDEENEERLKLIGISNLVHQTFTDAGFITDTRPLKLHCTLAKTSERKPPFKRGELFSFDDVLASTALQAIRMPPSTSEPPLVPSPSNSRLSQERNVRVSLGTYTIPEIQLCTMGSHGPEDEYVSVGGVSLYDLH